jgi:CHRD domain-containing protein
MFVSTILTMSFILYGLQYIIDQNVDAFDNYGINFVAPLDPYQVVSEDRNYDSDSHGIVYLSFDPSIDELSYEVFLEGMSYEEGDDVEIIQIHLGTPGENGPTVLSLCNEKKGKGHCREGPGLSVEGVLEEKDLKGPLKNSSFSELIKVFEHGQSYVYVQSRDHPEGEIRGQVSY